MEKIKSLQLNLINSVKISWPKTSRIQKAIIVSLGTLMVFLTLSYLSFVSYERVYADKIFPGINIQGIDFGGKTRVQANAYLASQVARLKSSNIYISDNDTNIAVKLSDLGVDFKTSEVVDRAYNLTRMGEFWQKFPKDLGILFRNENFNLVISYNDEQLTNKLNEIAGNTNKEAKNSTVSVSDELVTVVSEEWGSRIDLDQFKTDLENYILNKSNSAIFLQTTKIEPDIKSSQVELVKDEVTKIVFPTIVLTDTGADKEYFATPEEVANWIRLRANSNNAPIVEFKEEKISDFIKTISKQTDQKMINKKIKEKDDSVITEGQDGKALDQTQLLNDLRVLLVDRKIGKSVDNSIELVVEITPKGEEKVAVWEANPAGGGTPGLSEGKYIEINLSEQRLYLFNGTNAEGNFIISSGKASMPSPEGTFTVQNKNSRAWSATYKLYMPYWMSIGGLYGIHELPEWPGGYKEGEAHLGTPVSHGCVRLGVGAAETVYNWTPEGTPVFIHK